MEIINHSLHKVDHFSNQIIERDSKSIPVKYLKEIIGKVEEKKGVRRHRYISSTVESKTLIDNFFDGEFLDFKERFPHKLLEIEKIKHAQIIKMGNGIRAGVLFQVVYTLNNISKFIIVKSDNLVFLDDENFSLRTGLPEDKKVFKAMMVEKHQNGDERIYIYTEQKATYWWKEFLDLEELQTDEVNTDQAFKAIERRIGSLKSYKAEHRLLKNTLITYFRTKSEFDIVEISGIIGNYKPINPKLEEVLRVKLKKLEKDILKFPEEKNFDPKFNIISSAVPSRKLKEEIELRTNLILNIKGNIQALESVVKPKKIHGVKCIVIQTDIGYHEFGGN